MSSLIRRPQMADQYHKVFKVECAKSCERVHPAEMTRIMFSIDHKTVKEAAKFLYDGLRAYDMGNEI